MAYKDFRFKITLAVLFAFFTQIFAQSAFEIGFLVVIWGITKPRTEKRQQSIPLTRENGRTGAL